MNRFRYFILFFLPRKTNPFSTLQQEIEKKLLHIPNEPYEEPSSFSRI